MHNPVVSFEGLRVFGVDVISTYATASTTLTNRGALFDAYSIEVAPEKEASDLLS